MKRCYVKFIFNDDSINTFNLSSEKKGHEITVTLTCPTGKKYQWSYDGMSGDEKVKNSDTKKWIKLPVDAEDIVIMYFYYLWKNKQNFSPLTELREGSFVDFLNRGGKS